MAHAQYPQLSVGIGSPPTTSAVASPQGQRLRARSEFGRAASRYALRPRRADSILLPFACILCSGATRHVLVKSFAIFGARFSGERQSPIRWKSCEVKIPILSMKLGETAQDCGLLHKFVFESNPTPFCRRGQPQLPAGDGSDAGKPQNGASS